MVNEVRRRCNAASKREAPCATSLGPDNQPKTDFNHLVKMRQDLQEAKEKLEVTLAEIDIALRQNSSLVE